jgi:anti-sigma factor RsiW
MNAYDDETLGAYVDGELDDAEREALERALADDPELARRVEAQRQLRQALDAAFAPTLSEPVPERLLRAAREPGAGTVVPFRTPTDHVPRWQAPHWWALAASLVVGAVLGRQVGRFSRRQTPRSSRPGPMAWWRRACWPRRCRTSSPPIAKASCRSG